MDEQSVSRRAALLALVPLSLLAGLWWATQWSARLLGYAPWLGKPWTVWWGTPLYAPYQFVPWFWCANHAYPWAFARPRLVILAGVAVSLCSVIVARLWCHRQQAAPTTFGSSHWATWQDLRRSGLLEPDGVMLGRVRWKRQWRYLRHHGPEHVLVFAPTRTGKTTGLVIPTLLTSRDSVLVHDIKGENWEHTASWRQEFSHVIYFNPTSPHSARYNPLLEIRQGDNEVRDAQNVADILVDPEGAKEQRDHWEKTAHALLVGAILHVLYAGADKTLAGVAMFLADPKRSFMETLRDMMHTRHLGQRVHPVVASAAREVLNKAPNERSGVLSTAMSFLGLYRDPLIARTTSASDFRIADLQDADRPLSLYMVVPPSDLGRTKPLMRLLLNQAGRLLTEDLHARRRQKLLLMLDEFPALGRLDFFESALAFLASYDIRVFLITQSLNQLDRAYGPHSAILDNCHIRVAFAANDDRTARRISDLLGTTTQMRQQAGYMGRRWSLMFDRQTVTQSEVGRPMLTPGEVMQLDAEEEILFLAGHPPIRAQKIHYYSDPVFQRSLRPAPPLGAPALPVARGQAWTAEGTKAPTLLPRDDEAGMAIEEDTSASPGEEPPLDSRYVL